MQAAVVVGLGYGDEGKGLVTAYLAHKLPNSIVVRYTGGHQAGHTVNLNGIKHVFASFGSGSISGSPSYISEHCCMYPPFLVNEENILKEKGIIPSIYFHPKTKVTTPYDIAYNQVMEKGNNHGSVGVGIGTTMDRNLNTPYKLYVQDLSNKDIFHAKLEAIADYYLKKVRSLSGDRYLLFHQIVGIYLTDFLFSVQRNWNTADYNILKRYDYIIFEGAQGVMLDMDHGVFPNVTYGYTTSRNAHEICNYLDIPYVGREMYYVTRCYLTRHGNGVFPEKDTISLVNNSDETNVFNEWQKNFKVAELDTDLLKYALGWEMFYSRGAVKNMVITCLDQRPDFKFPFEEFTNFVSGFFISESPNSENLKQLTVY